MSQLYTKKGLWSLFLACVFPLQVWTIILSLSDFEWIAKRTNAWDAVGVIAYGLLFALVESILLCLVAALAGLLVSRKWEEARRIAVLSVLVLILSAWAMYEQSHFLWGVHLPSRLMNWVAATGRPVLTMYLLYIGPVVLSFLAPVLLILRGDRFLKFTQGVFERLSLLSAFYLVLDVAGIAIIIVRNLS
jgi:hypothetical protein